jgi:hypothetical protein
MDRRAALDTGNGEAVPFGETCDDAGLHLEWRWYGLRVCKGKSAHSASEADKNRYPVDFGWF